MIPEFLQIYTYDPLLAVLYTENPSQSEELIASQKIFYPM
jgi:hypothetical protein